MAATTKTPTKTTAESKEIREARRNVERCQKTLEGHAGRLASAYAELAKARAELTNLTGATGGNGHGKDESE
jgi:hypothetical protein